MDNVITQLGVGGIFVLLVLRELVPLLKNGRRNSTSSNNLSVRCAFDGVCSERHEALRRLVDSVNENVTAQTQLLQTMQRDLIEVKSKVCNAVNRRPGP